MTKRLVVDASVAIAAGEGQAENIQSDRCHEFLTAVMSGDFLVVMTEEIEREWKDPEKPRLTGNSRKWLTRLYGRKRIVWQDVIADMDIRNFIDALGEPEYSAKMRLLMLEDVHLLEAALVSDRNVTSLDETARKLFNKCALNMEKIQVIVWVNPTTGEDFISWLENSCPPEKQRQLGYVPDE